MTLTDQQVIFASLVGGGIVKQLPRFEVIQNEMQKHVLPSLSIFPVQNKPNTVTREAVAQMDNLWQQPTSIPEEKQFFPLSLSIDEGATWFLLPYETMINIDEKNVLKRRTVAKWKDSNNITHEGTVKERFSRDDATIEINGVLIGSIMTGNVEDCYPKRDFIQLRRMLRAAKAIYVKSPLLELYDINRIAVEDFSFPFSKGENVQAYTIKAYSDKSFNLILT